MADDNRRVHDGGDYIVESDALLKVDQVRQEEIRREGESDVADVGEDGSEVWNADARHEGLVQGVGDGVEFLSLSLLEAIEGRNEARLLRGLKDRLDNCIARAHVAKIDELRRKSDKKIEEIG